MDYAAEVLEAPPRVERIPSLPVPRYSNGMARSILERRTLPDQPIIFTDIMRHAPAMHKWTPAFFGRNHAQVSKVIDGRMVKLGDQVKAMYTSTEEDPAPYPFSVDIERELPELMNDLKPFVRYGSSDRTMHPLMPRFLVSGTIVHELFFGGRGSKFPVLHHDVLGMHTQITQIMGEKELVLYDPAQTPLLHTDPKFPRHSLVDDPFDPDLSRFPGFAEARPLRVLLKEGETIFFPAGWWHATRMHGPSITYGRAVVNGSNWHLMLRENLANWHSKHPRFAKPALAFGEAVGSAFWMLGR